MSEYEHDAPISVGLVREMDPADRPREKALRHGFSVLSDAEIMAILFGSGIPGKGIVELCKEILQANGNHLSLLTRKSVDDFTSEHKGIGKVKALILLAALELGERCQRDAKKIYESPPIRSAEMAYDYMRHHFLWLEQEEFWVLYLNRAGKPLKDMRISIGTSTFTPADIKVIVRNGLNCMANSVMLFHNHPSGQLRPSPDDDRLTKRISDAADLLDIRVLDHIIITDSGFYSYAEQGRL